MPDPLLKFQSFDPFRFTRRIGTEDERLRMIEAAAYRRAEWRGFSPGGELQDWLAAEAEVDQQIAVRADQ
jgi:hypothetical protein